MPKPNVVFRAALEDDESDRSEDEIVVIPYTKPPPVIIDLLESDASNDSAVEPGSKSPKKKSKKKKSKRDRERSGSRDVASLGDGTHESTVSSVTVDNISQHSNRIPDDECIECIEEISGSQDDEPTLVEDIGSGSGNVATNTNTSSIETPSLTSSAPLQSSELGASGMSSHFEKNAQSQSKEVDNGMRTETGMEMVGTTVVQNDKQKRVKARERKSKGEGKSRTRTLSATQRTNEEIVNFLTTLGIPMEPTAFDDAPITRRRQPRKRPSEATLLTDNNNETSPDFASSSNMDGQNLNLPISLLGTSTSGAFVTVTQDTGNALSRDSSKGKRQRQATSGDISDFTISFTNKDLNAISTNFQSNVLITDTSNTLGNVEETFISVSSSDDIQEQPSSSNKIKPNYYTQIIDAVAKGLDLSSPQSFNQPQPETNVARPAENELMNKTTNLCQMDKITVLGNNSGIQDKENFDGDPNVIMSEIMKNNDQVSADAGKDVEPTCQLSSSAVSSGMESGVTSNQIDENLGKKAATQTLIGTKEIVETISLDSSETTDTNEVVVVSAMRGEETNDCTSSRTTSATISLKRTPKEGYNKRKIGDTVKSPKLSTGKRGEENSSIHITRRSPERKRHKIDRDIQQSTSLNPVRSFSGKERRFFQGDSTPTFPRAPLSQQSSANNNCATTSRQESYFPCTWSEHMKDFYGSSRNEDFELDEVWPSLSDSADLWQAHNDMMPPPRNKKWRHVRCDRCKQLGHLVKECKEKWRPPTCHYCGKAGHTSDSHSRHSRTCPSALCLNCGRRSSRYAQKCHKCLLLSRPVRCEICNVTGHDELICPDNWRRYHSVTSSDEYEMTESMLKAGRSAENDRKNSPKDHKLYKRSSTLFCANCGRRGHSYYDCNASKFNPYPRNKPFVIREADARKTTVGPSTSSPKPTCIPISYDSRTGRTVIMNAETKDQPKLAVETIQVKITNELALQSERELTSNHIQEVNRDQPRVLKKDISSSAISTPVPIGVACACEEIRCTNNLVPDEKCYQSWMQAQAHSKLLQAQDKGILKVLEEKHQVQISVIDDRCRIHICGLSALETDKDLHRLVKTILSNGTPQTSDEIVNFTVKNNSKKEFTQTSNTVTKNIGSKRVEIEFKSKISSSSNSNVVSATVKPVELVTVDDDEDDCCVIEEVESIGLESTSKASAKAKESQGTTRTSATFCIDKLPSGASNKDESPEDAENVAAMESAVPCADTSLKSPWSEYVSPLTGLSISCNNSKQSSINEVQEHYQHASTDIMWPTSDKQHTNNESSDSFECEEIDYSKFSTAQEQVGKSQELENSSDTEETTDSSDSDSDLSVLDPPVVDKDVEIITLDDDDPINPVFQKPTLAVERNEESVTLLSSEWDLAITELAKTNNIINQISQIFNVDIVVSKETSSIIIRKGLPQDLQEAKTEIVGWLESKCLNEDYHLNLNQRQVHARGTSSPLKRKKRSRQKVLKLRDVHVGTGQTPIKKQKKKPNKKFFKRGNTHSPNSSFASSPSSSSSGSRSFNNGPSSPMNHSSSFNKRNFAKSSLSSPFRSKGLSHSPSPKRMKQQNCSNDSTSTGFLITTPKAYNRPKSRYFHN